jgi:hypothetical protein
MTVMMMRNKGVMMVMGAVRRMLRKRKRRSPVMRGWNTTRGHWYPPSTPQVHPLIESNGAKTTSGTSTMPVN